MAKILVVDDAAFMRMMVKDALSKGGYTDVYEAEDGAKAVEEFERLLPAMKSGRYIPSVDHQTPPDVTLDNYKIYVSLLKEYAQKAMQD